VADTAIAWRELAALLFADVRGQEHVKRALEGVAQPRSLEPAGAYPLRKRIDILRCQQNTE